MDYKSYLNPNSKPDGISQDVWDLYVSSGDHKRFWKLFGEKTLFTTLIITFGVNLILNEMSKYFDSVYFSLILGIALIIIGVCVILFIDKMEEYERLKKLEEDLRNKNKVECEEAEIVRMVKEDFVTKSDLKEIIHEEMNK